ncbi:hypothetical protein ACFQ22_03775 [Lentilactobacillus raoultii]|uniref:Uncharacterized protein n=1 Tax=Lentilactobacillus raoultii TaxID=1987503 RepID=A0ABW3PKS5_9LACO|nr:hypothetical protein [Lentilactobacillus raoultii]
MQPLVNHSSPLVLMIAMPTIALTLLWISEKIAGTDRLAFTTGPFVIGVLSGIGLKALFVALM